MLLLSYLKKKWIFNDLFNEFKDKKQVKKDLLSWSIVALALIPEAIAFSFVAWIDPMIWLHTAFIIWIITSIFWWRPAMISAFTWALAVVMVSLVQNHWIEYLYATAILMWIFQIIFWLLKWWKLFRLIPYPVMLWFVNGLAILIFLSQIDQFKINWEWITWTAFITMILLIAITMAIIHFLPKFTNVVPSSLVAIVFVTLLVLFVPWLEDSRTIASFLADNWFGPLTWSFPTLHIPQIEVWFLEMMYIITPYAIVLAIIWTIESLMTLSLIDDITETRWHSNKEAIWQWLANWVSWIFGWAAGCAMIGQSMINIKNGWRWRLSWISASIILILLIVFAAGVINIIPLAALIWLMFMVVIWTFAWPTLKMLNKIPKSDAFVLLSVTIITVITWDLAIAVIIWVIISALVFAWQKSKDISANKFVDEKWITHYELDWPLFFASTEKFADLFDIKNDSKEVIIDFAKSKVLDLSWIEAINNLTDKYSKKWKTLHLKHLSSDCRRLIKNADEIVDVNIIEDPRYFVSKIWEKSYKNKEALS